MTIQNIQSGYGNATVEYSRKAVSAEETYLSILEQKLAQQDEVIQNGSTEESIAVGGAAFTSEEWEEMLANFDATMDDVREQMRVEHARRYEEQLEKEYQHFSTSKYEVIADDEFGCYEVYNKAGERVGAFFYSDIAIKTDSMTGTQLLISEHGTAAYDALILDYELITGFEKSMGVEKLENTTLTGYTLNRHVETGIRYLVKDGDEGRGGRLLINSDAELAAIDELAESYLRDYPNLVSNKEVAQINAVLEVVGLMQRTPNGIVSVNRDGASYNDNADSKKNWALLFEGDYYERVFEFVKQHRVTGTDLSDYDLWDQFNN